MIGAGGGQGAGFGQGGVASGGLRLEELLMTIRAEYEGLALSTLDARRGGDEFETIGELQRWLGKLDIALG